jgi:hypothetical protein
VDPSSALAWMRGLERLGIVGLSGVSLILGWDLFRRGVSVAQSADFKAQGWTVRLQRVGPGIFFALFGTAAFISVVAHPLTITTGKQIQQESKPPGSQASAVTTESQTISEVANPSTATDRDVIAAINTFHVIVIPKITNGFDANYSLAINKADQTLDSYKRSLMFQHFGQMSIQFYSVRDEVPVNPSVLGKQPLEFQDKYPEIEGWDKDTFLRRR